MSATQITEAELIACLQKATKVGSEAANKRVVELAKIKVSEGKLLDACGGSTLTIYVDGRTKTGRLLSKLTAEGIRVSKAYQGGYSVNLPYEITIIPPVNGQEQSIYYAADSAAAKLISNCLGAKVYASAYDS